ncbi:DUF4142 domain-containing protein [Hymenobacter sp. 15J16-1T3B]|uniref:DUF4142 domain-containing protein n=1 Tax=Hymenobacter sp. 15J16-1T3B TaxID=2886941 RepID=UPI001D10F944|nr:DUF4142 domain-containing protein [Hymenobacter sp. 15J16-1T3B]MCC3157991.1 DUF4142 domain-containing protein [Hymenobacter sp. 15J16-1T3B]
MPNARRLSGLPILLLLVLGACQQAPKTEQPVATTRPDGHTPPACPLDPFGCFFMPMAGCAGIFEVEAGTVAAERATRPAVQAYAAQMVTEHSAINGEYRALMRRKGLVPPNTTLRVYRQKIDSLRRLPADQFDAYYAQMMVVDHRNAVRLFGQAADSARDADYKEWLGRMQTIVARHADHAATLLQGLPHAHHGAGSR